MVRTFDDIAWYRHEDFPGGKLCSFSQKGYRVDLFEKRKGPQVELYLGLFRTSCIVGYSETFGSKKEALAFVQEKLKLWNGVYRLKLKLPEADRSK